MQETDSAGESTKESIRKASLKLIYEKGYAATSLRDLAAEVGIQPASLYNYIKTKEDLLFYLVKETLEQRLVEIKSAVQKAQNPLEAFKAYVRLGLVFHTLRRREMVIGSSELKSLSPQHYGEIVALRDEFDGTLTKVIERGMKEGFFPAQDPRILTFAVLSLVSGVSRWYRDGGRLTEDEVFDMYMKIAFRIVGYNKYD